MYDFVVNLTVVLLMAHAVVPRMNKKCRARSPISVDALVVPLLSMAFRGVSVRRLAGSGLLDIVLL